MEVKDINPHLRFVDKINFMPIQKYFRAVDCHFYYIPDGHTVIYIDGTRYDLKRGSAVIVPAGVEYYFVSEGNLRIVSFNFDFLQDHRHLDKTVQPILSENFDEADIIERPCFEDQTFLNQPIVLDNMEYLEGTVNAVLKEYSEKRQFYREVASGYFKNVILEIIRSVVCEGRGRDTVEVILEYIRGHYHEDIDNAALSQLVGYHPYHLNRLMKSCTGTTLRQYLIDYRMAMAKKLLYETEERVADIAERCGYKNISSFSKDFKSRNGMSPIKYRSTVKHIV